jgi:hypothetical protein
VKALRNQLSHNLISSLDVDGDGHCTELEYVVGMIIALGAEVS